MNGVRQIDGCPARLVRAFHGDLRGEAAPILAPVRWAVNSQAHGQVNERIEGLSPSVTSDTHLSSRDLWDSGFYFMQL
jgi:hypothetical protein